MIIVDTCGMSCPQPVLMTKKALKDNAEAIEIVVDNNVAKGNVERFLKSVGYTASILEKDDVYIINARK